MDNSIENIIYAAIIGDASGYTLGGMKKAHIHAVFRGEEGYLDPSPALKNNMDRWRKPGLYSSITQMMLFAASSVERNVFRGDRFADAVRNAPELPGSEYSFFRDPGLAEQHFISASRTEKKDSLIPFSRSCSRILPIAIPLLLADNEKNLLDETLKLVSLFTADTATAACSFIFLRILKDLSLTDGGVALLENALESSVKALDLITENQHRIFRSGYNPDYLLRDAGIFCELMEKVTALKDAEKCEKLICESANARQKSPVTRASVNLPETVLPFALVLASSSSPRSSVFHKASREGGAASALASVTAALTAACFGADIPDELKDGLANKKKISHVIELLAAGSGRGEIAAILYDTEPGLTSKEAEEFRARNKKEQKKPVPGKTRKDAESELTKHVVESWTKIDKAKWRKERGKHDS